MSKIYIILEFLDSYECEIKTFQQNNIIHAHIIFFEFY
jgi:hypothetical protein